MCSREIRDTSDKIPALAFAMERCISAAGRYSVARCCKKQA
jgi:hypothetical protein